MSKGKKIIEVEEFGFSKREQAYDVLEAALDAKTEKQTRKLAKQAYEISDRCIEAAILVAELSGTSIERNKLVDEAIEKERKYLEKEKYFEEVGAFYSIWETRPYMRSLYRKVQFLFEDKKYNLAIEKCNEILKLNEGDNMGVRYVLMLIYGILEKEQELLDVYNNYEEESFHTLIPFLMLYYKKEDEKQFDKYYKKMKKANKDFEDFVLNEVEPDEIMEGYYRHGDISEIFVFMKENIHFLGELEKVFEYIIEKNILKEEQEKIEKIKVKSKATTNRKTTKNKK